MWSRVVAPVLDCVLWHCHQPDQGTPFAGPQGSPRCGIFQCQTGKVLGKIDSVGHPNWDLVSLVALSESQASNGDLVPSLLDCYWGMKRFDKSSVGTRMQFCGLHPVLIKNSTLYVIGFRNIPTMVHKGKKRPIVQHTVLGINYVHLHEEKSHCEVREPWVGPQAEFPSLLFPLLRNNSAYDIRSLFNLSCDSVDGDPIDISIPELI